MSTTLPSSGQTVPQGAKEMSAADRCFGVFTEPAKTFASIVRKPDCLAPLIAMIVLSIVTIQLLLSRVGAVEIVRRSLEESGRASTMSTQQMQQALTTGAKYTAGFMHVSSVIGVPILVLILAVVGMFIMKLFFGRPVRFKTAYSLATYAEFPTIIAWILAIIVVEMGDPAAINPRNLTPTNFGFFLPRGSVSKFVMSIGTSVDLFSFWVMALLGIAFASSAKGKVKPRSVFFCFLGLWIIFVLIRAGLTAI